MENMKEFKEEFDRKWDAQINACEAAGLELRQLRINLKLSEETIAGTADIYLNGKKIGDCANRGFGGNFETYLKDAGWTFEQIEKAGTGIEGFEALENWLSEKFHEEAERKELQNMARARFTFQKPGQGEGEYFQIKWPAKVRILADKVQFAKHFAQDERFKGCTVLNPKDGTPIKRSTTH